MTNITIHFKCPDAVGEAIKEATAHINDPSERISQEEILRSKISPWVDFGEYVSIEIDLANGTARVLPARR